MFFYQFVHSSESIFGCSGKFSQRWPFKCVHTFFFKNWLWSVIFFSKKSWKFQEHVGFSTRQLIFLFSLFLFIMCLFLFLVCLYIFITNSKLKKLILMKWMFSFLLFSFFCLSISLVCYRGISPFSFHCRIQLCY